MRRVTLVAVLLLLPCTLLNAQASRTIKVAVEFRQSGAHSREGVQAGGSVIITERGGVRPRGSVGADSTQTRVRRSTGIFTLVQDGGEATLTVAAQVPYAQVAYYRDYASGAGHVAAGVVFREVGTSLRVRASLLPGAQVRVRLTPAISYFAADGSGTIEFTEATTEMIVPSGRPVVLAGSTTSTHEITRRILGSGERQSATETTVVLTATAQ